MRATVAISFCFHATRFRPSVLAALRSAQAANPSARIFVYCDPGSMDAYAPFVPAARFTDLARFHSDLGTSDPLVAARRMRALSLLLNGGWYLDAFDTLTLRALPEPRVFTIGEECWDQRRRCTGACAAPKGDSFAGAWLESMRRVRPGDWDHWTDQSVCNALIDSGRFAFEALHTGRLNWPSESGFTGELRLSEDQVAWLLEHAWVLHYFGRGALGQAYKEMDLAALRRCRELGGFVPRLVLSFCEREPRPEQT